jgi:uncharacterized protein YcfJ
MKRLLILPLALIASGTTLAQEVGRVISTTPVMQQVGVPHQVCTTEQVTQQQPKSGAGALMGAIAGGAMGNAVGGGDGKAAATLLGIIGGAAIGDSVEGAPGSQFQNVQRCTTQNFFENKPVAYNVVYEFGGNQYSVQMPHDPGPTLQLQVTPVGATSQMAPQPSTVTYAQPTYVVVERPVYSGYYAPNYLPPFAIGLGSGYWSGRGGHWSRAGHWR